MARATEAEPRGPRTGEASANRRPEARARQRPQHELAFRHGQAGEESVGTLLDEPTAHGPTLVLHDRTPRGLGDVHHVAIAPTAVYVIDAKAWHGKVSAPTPLFGRQKLLIAGRDRTSLVDGLDRQVEVVRAALGEGHGDVAVRDVL